MTPSLPGSSDTEIDNPPAPSTKTPPRAGTRRRYDDGCAAAHALDLVGERWALLIVRELLLGARRFSDLRQTLGGISPNVLTQRLSDLSEAGIVRQHELPAPASCRVYALTAWGMELEPVIMELLKWGVRSPGFERGRSLTADAMALSLKAMLVPHRARRLTCRITLVMDRNRYHVALEGGEIAITRGEPPCHPAEAANWASVTVYAEPVTILHLAYGKRPLKAAVNTGACRYEGDARQLERFLSCFEVAPAVA